MLILFIFDFLVAILNIYFVFNENVELIVNFIVPFDLWIMKFGGMPHELSLYVNEYQTYSRYCVFSGGHFEF